MCGREWKLIQISKFGSGSAGGVEYNSMIFVRSLTRVGLCTEQYELLSGTARERTVARELFKRAGFCAITFGMCVCALR